MGRDWVEVKIDVDRHANGKAVAERLRQGRGNGIPWMVITDADGNELVTSDGPQGNVGCPVLEHEVAWFMEMLAKTAQHVGEEGLAAIRDELEAYAEPMR